MPLRCDLLSALAHGDKAGRLAASEMLEATDGGPADLRGLMTKLDLVGDLVAERYQRDGMQPLAVRKWRFGFHVGLGIELDAHFRKLQIAVSPARRRSDR